MRLSRGWRRLLLSWAGAVSLCIVSAGTFEFVGSIGESSQTALDQRIIADSIQSASVVPATIRVDPPAPPSPIMETARQTEPAQAVAVDGTTSRDTAVEPGSQPVVTAPVAKAESRNPQEPRRKTARIASPPQTNTPQGKRLNLRITRDTERCPVVVCYRYHLVTERRKLPRHALVDLASLHLAPDLRSRVDRAHIDLLIEAVEHRKTINGRETQVFVATNLAGVTPHDSPF
jgi:hypothetical protein